MNQSLVGSLVINAELGREDYCLIPATTIRRGLEPHDIRTDLRTTITGGESKKKKKLCAKSPKPNGLYPNPKQNLACNRILYIITNP
jgi:hypothetical protein